MIDIQTAAMSDFEPCLDQVFSSEVGNHRIELVLSKCELSNPGAHDGTPEKRHPFSLTFIDEGQSRLPQGTYALQNETIGEVAMFLVPIGMGKYEAIFN